MGLMLLEWQGEVTDTAGGGSAVEEFSSRLALITDPGVTPGDVMYGGATPAYPAVYAYFTRADTKYAPNAHISLIKCNLFDVVTGHQITDPTVEQAVDGWGTGSGTDILPFSTAYRVSLDDGTRSRRSKGGWFVGPIRASIQVNGRFTNIETDTASSSAKTLIDSLNSITGVTVGVWSKTGGFVTAVTRLRVGDVPDDISRRRRDLIESYYTRTITP